MLHIGIWCLTLNILRGLKTHYKIKTLELLIYCLILENDRFLNPATKQKITY